MQRKMPMAEETLGVPVVIQLPLFCRDYADFDAAINILSVLLASWGWLVLGEYKRNPL